MADLEAEIEDLAWLRKSIDLYAINMLLIRNYGLITIKEKTVCRPLGFGYLTSAKAFLVTA